jgi:hypothetical protein
MASASMRSQRGDGGVGRDAGGGQRRLGRGDLHVTVDDGEAGMIAAGQPGVQRAGAGGGDGRVEVAVAADVQRAVGADLRHLRGTGVDVGRPRAQLDVEVVARGQPVQRAAGRERGKERLGRAVVIGESTARHRARV